MLQTGCSPQPRSPIFEYVFKIPSRHKSSQGNCPSRSSPLSLADWHRHPRPGRLTNSIHGWPDSMVIEYGAHPRHHNARPSWFGTPPPRSGSVRGRCHSRLACLSLVSPCTPSRCSYGPPRGSHLAPGPSRKLSLSSSRPGGLEYSSSFTPGHWSLRTSRIYGRRHQIWSLPDGCSASHLLANEPAASASQGYGCKWERFVKFCCRRRSPLPASVETIGCYLDHISREGRVTGSSIRPYLAAINTVHTRAGFPSPTKDPVIASIRVGYNRATADRAASRPRSVALPSALGTLVVKAALRSRSPTPITAIVVVGFLPALRPMPIQGILPKTSPRPQLRSSSAYAVRKAMQANAMTAFSAFLSMLLQTQLLCCSHDSLDTARVACCSRSPLPGSTAPSCASVVRPPFAPTLGRITCRSLRSG
jgi:hypothetical protein